MYYLPKTFIGRLLLICIIVSVLLGYSYHAIGSATDDAGVPMVVKQHIIDNNNYHGEEISLNFQDIPVRQVLQLIADVAGFNLITSDAVTGNVTLHLQNIPWDQALDLLLATHGLDKRQFDNVLMIAPAAEIAEQERQAAAANQQIAALAPLYTEHFRIRYANAQKLYELFTAGNKASQQVAKVHLLSERGSIIVDERTNSLLITDTATRLAEFQDMVELLDVPVRQVLIEARIVIAKSNVDEQLGVRWGGVAVGSVDGNPLVASGTMDGLVATENNLDSSIPLDLWPDRNGLPIDLGNSLGVNLGVNAPTGSFAVGYIGANVALNLELSALESRGQGEICFAAQSDHR